MVSTRGVKIKFTEGERVLCYEPDPSKTKVLYDSKVLEVVCNKDSKGRTKQVEYLIHFQGWNASWDRCVSEDLVLKDTIENRDLQRELAENAHIKLSIKSNRVLLGQIQSKENKRLSQSSDNEKDSKRKSQGGSDTSSQDGNIEEDNNSMNSEADCPNVNECDESSDEEIFSKQNSLIIPDALKAVLEKDFHLINEKNKLLNLPAKKTVLAILDDYVRYFAMRYVARSKEKRNAELKEKDKVFMTLELCKEIVDSLRVCFDFHINTLLLYNNERKQAERLKDVEHIHEDSVCKSPSEFGDKDILEEIHKDKEVFPKRQLRSKRSLGEDSALAESKDVKSQQIQSNLTCESGRSTPTTLTSGVSGAVGSGDGNNDLLLPLHNTESFLHQQLKDWTLLPEMHRDPTPPVMKYGALHLLRLFVRLPQILYRMTLQPNKKRYIIKHLELFLEYLNSHNQEFFSDSNYILNPDF